MKKILLLTIIMIGMAVLVMSQTLGVNTDGTNGETMLDIKIGTAKATTAAVTNVFQLKSANANTDAIKLRFGFKTDATVGNRYGFVDFADLAAGVPTYRTLSLQPLGGNIGIGTTSATYKLHVIGSSTSAMALTSNTGSGDGLRSYGVPSVGYAAFWGDNTPTTNGSGYSITTCNAALQGQIDGVRTYSFGLMGFSGSTNVRVGGVLGCGPYVGQWGILGYETSGGISWGIYYSNDAATGGASTGTGKKANPTLCLEPAYGLGIGGYADLLGAGIVGGVYGAFISGNRFGSYTDGKAFFNNDIVSVKNNIPMFIPTSLTNEIIIKGKALLDRGIVYVHLDSMITNLIKDDIIVIVTPRGVCNQLYVIDATKKGFLIIENNNGESTVEINYIVYASQVTDELPIEVLSKEYSTNMRKVVGNENTDVETLPIWWNGTNLNFTKYKHTRKLNEQKRR